MVKLNLLTWFQIFEAKVIAKAVGKNESEMTNLTNVSIKNSTDPMEAASRHQAQGNKDATMKLGDFFLTDFDLQMIQKIIRIRLPFAFSNVSFFVKVSIPSHCLPFFSRAKN